MARIFYPNRGFTILEVMVAILIFTLGIIAVLGIFPVSTKTQLSAKMTTTAVQLAQEKIEEISAQSYSNISSEPEQTLASPFNAYSRKTEVNYYDPINSTTTIEDLGIKKVKVTISWMSPLGAVKKKLDLVSLISRR